MRLFGSMLLIYCFKTDKLSESKIPSRVRDRWTNMAPVEGNEEHAREAMWDLTLLISSSAVRMIDAHADEVCVQRMTVHLRSVLFFLNQLFHS